MTTLFLAIDGDDVGRALEYLVLQNRVEELAEVSRKFAAATDELSETLVNRFGARIYLAGGDSILASMPSSMDHDDMIEQLRQEATAKAGFSFSFGIGETPRQAYLALKLAKLSGKNRLCHYMDLANV